MEASSPKIESTNSHNSKLPTKKNSHSKKPSTENTLTNITQEDPINLFTMWVTAQEETSMWVLPKEAIAILTAGEMPLIAISKTPSEITRFYPKYLIFYLDWSWKCWCLHEISDQVLRNQWKVPQNYVLVPKRPISKTLWAQEVPRTSISWTLHQGSLRYHSRIQKKRLWHQPLIR